jgi:hypothetical protein
VYELYGLTEEERRIVEEATQPWCFTEFKAFLKYSSNLFPYRVNIYIDESGDIGSGSRSSDYFVIAAMVVRDPLCVKRCFSRIRRSKLKKKWKKIPEFKFNNTGNILKRRILDCLANCDLDIAYSVLRKRQLYPNLRDKPQIMYNYLTGSLIAKIIGHYRVNDEVVVLVDKSLRGIQRENFDQYVVV